MALLQRVTEAEYRELALREPDRKWELLDGIPREKQPMSVTHNRFASLLGHHLWDQIDWDRFEVRVNAPFARISSRNYFIPDVAVIPTDYTAVLAENPYSLDAYAEPLPLVVEVWSPSTGDSDATTKLDGYIARGDREIVFVHPYERTLTAWRRQADGSYTETTYHGGIVEVASLPGVRIDLDALLDRRRPGS